MVPVEVISGPFEIWTAPVATAFPNVDTTPPSPWVLLGTNGSLNQDESGVTVTHDQSINPWTPAGSTLPRKAFRESESMMVECKIADLSVATYATILGDRTITAETSSPTRPATSRFSLQRGSTIAEFACLVRGLSPAGEAFSAQYQIPRCYEGGSQKPEFVKGEPATLDCQFVVLDDDSGPPLLVVQTGAHS